MINRLTSTPSSLALLHQLQSSLVSSLKHHKKIYYYGCGATGRLAKAMESVFWRKFWENLKMHHNALWESKIKNKVSPTIIDDCIGEMTGADRALIASLEGFEDLLLIGEMQLQDRGIKQGDLIIAVTEGGETSSVIGTILAGLKQWENNQNNNSSITDDEIRSHLYFVYNNPDEVLLPFDRSKRVISEPLITKLNLTTGPQAITGSTRMQATTSETFVLATVLACAIEQFLRENVGLNEEEMKQIGFGNHHHQQHHNESSTSSSSSSSLLISRLLSFPTLLTSLRSNLKNFSLATLWESETYANGYFSTYFALQGLFTVFIDNTERSPTFRLFALDSLDLEPLDKRRCFLQIWTSAKDGEEAWNNFLGRSFYGMNSDFYQSRFENEISDTYLRKVALRSLPFASSDQSKLYDFSFSKENQNRRGGIQYQGDLGVLVLMNGEENLLKNVNSDPSLFIRKLLINDNKDIAQENNKSRVVILILTDCEKELQHNKNRITSDSTSTNNTTHFSQLETYYKHLLFTEQHLPASRINLSLFHISSSLDPLGINSNIACKILLNAHSTATMTKLGKVLGNTMINCSPSNLKLIGRATNLIRMHVNEMAEKTKHIPKISYELANAVLYDSIEFIKNQQSSSSSSSSAISTSATAGSQSPEIPLSIIRILQSLAPSSSSSSSPCTAEFGLSLLQEKSIGGFLEEFEKKYKNN